MKFLALLFVAGAGAAIDLVSLFDANAKHTAVSESTVGDVPPICHTVPPALWCSCRTLAEKCGHATVCAQYAHAAYNEPLHITLLYESLCPDCQEFIAEQLYPRVYNTHFREMVRIELIPYGNARHSKNGSIECQHGAKECEINKFQSCAIHFIDEPLPFVHCLEAQIQRGKSLEDAGRKCYTSTTHTVPHIYDQIVHCANSALGDSLQAAAAARTRAVWPDAHEHVPWLLFNNVSLSAQQFVAGDLPQAICQFYIGDHHADYCSGVGAAAANTVATRRRAAAGCAREW